MRLIFNSITENLLDFLFPKYCLGCQKAGSYVCKACLAKIRTPGQASTQFFCAAPYKNRLVRDIIHAFKYDLIKELGMVCAEVIAQAFKKRGITFGHDWTITFVPIHKHRQALRGFNQAELIARWLGEILELEVFETLEKTKQTKSQTELGYEARSKNVLGVFRSKVPVQKKKFLLIDDVCTTGSTLLECSKTLLKSGAAEVRCIAFARD